MLAGRFSAAEFAVRPNMGAVAEIAAGDNYRTSL
jgi:hypothetical protein